MKRVSPEEASVLLTAAKERYQQIGELWTQEGCPLLTEGSQGQLVEHPLVKMQREHEKLIADLESRANIGRSGPQPSAVPSIKKPRSARLRAVGE